MDARVIRKKLGLNQQAFWSRLGVTQSGGSRYESGRNIPKPVRKLIGIAFGTTSECNSIVNELRSNTPKDEDVPEDTRPDHAYYTVVSGATKETALPLSGPVSSLAKALAFYNEGKAASDDHGLYLAIEYHVSLTEKYVFQPDRVIVTVE